MTDARPVIPPARPVFPADDRAAILSMIDEALSSGALTLGEITRRFEAVVTETVGVGHAVAVASGTAALEVIMRASGLAEVDVVVPTNTFFATAAAIVHAGGRPVLADIDAGTMTLSRSTVEAALTDKTAAVVLVHIGGAVSAAVNEVRQLCDARGLLLIEDAAHAHGATYDGRAAGSFGWAGAFSFYPTKVVTSAEGGMIVTNDAALAQEAQVFRDQGKSGFIGGEHTRLGYAWRMSELHAAVGLVQWARLAEFIERRCAVAAMYDDAFSHVAGIEPLSNPTGSRPNYYKYIAVLDPNIDRSVLKARLREEHGVSLSGEVYARPLHREPVFADLVGAGFPVADEMCRRHVCLPVHSDMTDAEAQHVVAAVATVLSELER